MKRGRKPKGYGERGVVRAHRAPWQISQASVCGCRGTNDMCTCQNMEAPWLYGLAPWPVEPDWKTRAVAAEAQVSALQAQVDGLRGKIATAWYDGFVEARKHEPWPDMFDWAALTGQDYAAALSQQGGLG